MERKGKERQWWRDYRCFWSSRFKFPRLFFDPDPRQPRGRNGSIEDGSFTSPPGIAIGVELKAKLGLSLSAGGDDDEGTARQELYSALRKCRQHTVRSLSFPSLPGAMMEDGEIDTRQSLVGILSSGLPLPKSPSIQMDEASKGQRRDAIDGEREERGWWTLRFQQVLRELQRE